MIFLYFQKAIRSELDRLHRAAVELVTGGGGDISALAERCRFLCDIYKHHCNAEDAVGITFYVIVLVSQLDKLVGRERTN